MDEFTIGELFYCLIQDIEDYLMHNEDDGLDYILQLLDSIKTNYDNNSFQSLDMTKLVSVLSYLKTKGLNQLSEDTKVIIERLNNEIK